MEKENKLKLKLSRIFTSSCKTQDLSEVIDHKNPIFTPKNNTIIHKTPLMEVVQQEEDYYNSFSSPMIKQKQTPTSSCSSSSSSVMYCKPRCPETFDQMIRENCIIATGNPIPRRKIAGKYSLLSPNAEFSGGRQCPPASPASPLFSKKQGNEKKKKNDNKRRKKKKSLANCKNENTLLKNSKRFENPNQFSLSSSNETDFGDWFSSDDEREEEERETLHSLNSVSFSSKSISFSSDSDPDGPARTRVRARNRRRRPGSRLRKESSRVEKKKEKEKEVEVVPLEGKVEDTFAVVKNSSDPYNDFRASMAEMIIEKQIFGTKELEQLLHCFLSLNSPHHHRIIVEVFTEIWDALFSHFS